MIVIDSSGWLEYFTGGPLADTYAAYVQGDEPVMVPAVVVYEVYRALRRQVSEAGADEAALQLTRRRVEPLDGDTALAAADLSLTHGLPFADACIYAAAQMHGATIVTSDQHLASLPEVRYIPKPGCA